MADCGCDPGDNENGYHETRSETCKAIELEQWAIATKLSRQMAYEEYKKNHSRFDCLVAYPDEYFEEAWQRAEESVNRSIERSKRS